MVLATQNPVDLDYKGLANTGTWFLGRLQTERDKARVLDGLEGTAGGLDRAEADRLLSALKKRIFLMHNVHDAEPDGVRDPLDAVIPARAALAGPDQGADRATARIVRSSPAGAGQAPYQRHRRRPHRPRLPRRAAPSVLSFPLE